jgi:hypothetical protein
MCLFLLGSRIAFILNLDESIKSLHCSGHVEAEISCNIRLPLPKKMIISRPVLEGSSAEAMIQVAEP